jgi:hypothetical protein
MSNTDHRAILGLGNTLEPANTFPLIMVVGREPSINKTVTAGLGRYTFWNDPALDDPNDHVHDCGFWNTAYTVMARTLGLNHGTAREAKELCKPMRLSPVIFSDVMPVGVRNEVSTTGKNAARDGQDQDRIRAHIEHIFSHKAILDRVRLVLLSGHLASASLARASAHYEETCRARGIPVQTVPFMYGTNTPAIMESLTPKHKAIIRQVWTESFI